MKRIAIAILLASIGLAGCVDREAQKQAKRTEEILADRTVRVRVAPAVATTLSETLELTGQVVTSDDAVVGARTAGRIAAVYVRDGDAVAAGAPIAQMDTAQLTSALRQAQGQLAGAQAQLGQAIANQRINPQRTASAVAVAEAQLRSAKAQLAKAKRGARTEEVRQAEIQVTAAKSNLETAKRERDRQLNLYKEGATSLQRYEVAENQYQQALSQYESALEMLQVRRNQTQPEDLRSAEEAVTQAEENLRNARAQKALDVTLDQQVLLARAQVSTAMATVDLARQNLADATIRAPFAGKVSGKPVQPGTVLAPGSPVVRLIGVQGVYFEGMVPESEVANVVPGKPVSVTFDALGGQKFTGRVATVNPLGDSVGRQFRVRISLDNPTADVKPGMFARGLIEIRSISDAVMVPKTSVRTEEGKDFVFLLQDGKAVRREVVVGIERGDLVQVSGLRGGESVIVEGQFQVKDGDAVKVESAQAGAKSSEKVEG